MERPDPEEVRRALRAAVLGVMLGVALRIAGAREEGDRPSRSGGLGGSRRPGAG